MYSLILHGRRFLELQKWRNLRVSVKLFQNASSLSNSFSSATAANVSPRDTRKEQNLTVSYLVDSLGLTRKLAESISRKVNFEEKGNPDSVLNLLRSYGFTDSQISIIISSYPKLLIADAEKSLGPKLKFLQSRGASSSELADILSKVPEILGMRWDKAISIYYDCVKEIIEADKSSKYVKLSHSLPQGCNQENKIRNVLVLRDLGVPQRFLFTLLISDTGPVHGKEKFQESLRKVVDLGFDPRTSKFVEALGVVYGYSGKTIEEKVNGCKRLGFVEGDVWEMFKKWPYFLSHSMKKITQTYETLKKCGLNDKEVLSVFKKHPLIIRISEQKKENSTEAFLGVGFSREEFTAMIKRYPPCIGYSAESLRKKTDFVVKNMNWPLKAVVLFPQVLGYSMEKRIVPRCNVIKALISKGLLGDRESKLPPVSSVLSCTDQTFLDRYVMKQDEKLVPELLAIFTRDYKPQ